MLWLELVVVLAMIFVGARVGGAGLGMMGGLGVALLAFVFGERPTEPPIDVMLMIAAVCTAAACLQASGGMDYLVKLAEKALRSYPPAVTFVAPLVAYVFTLFAGTGHVAYAILPVIAEVSRDAGVRPERPLSISVIASQQAITASPISAATVALLGLLAPAHVTLLNILSICIPATVLGVLAGSLAVFHRGVELADDPVYKQRLAAGELKAPEPKAAAAADGGVPVTPITAKIAVLLFLAAAVAIVFLGSFPGLRPAWTVDGKVVQMGMAHAIEMVMLSVSALMVVFCKANVEEVAKGTVFRAGMQAVIAIFGIAWLGDTFFQAHLAEIQPPLERLVQAVPWLFAVALFVMSILLYSQAATIRALGPLGVALGLPAFGLIGAFPAVNGYFFIPNYPTLVAAINFDRTGTTRIGKWVLNHSFQLPGFVATTVAVVTGLVLGKILM
ncbi:anaerobic C4-dicarboxylate transporter family protein [Anaeromyxobacter oryzae]|uniref:C4-dicarboxylate ABC transporter n=1 Tax=Anaeromyxobacter oryzae TaxID=2918170 RepID=A0ABN6MLL9_9BACT|nr:anaerobic C4-dicarboxylate transporter [Anaeromyxobacter oryzae]BDG01928.1 C4-dicarboxylate ABC transporter [Anaeromyxobacter oryzae]